MLSYWESSQLLSTEIAIVGGGITGLSVAASLKERNPKLKITVFERSVLPYGASTRNAGFACFGSLTEVLHDIDVMGSEKARELLFDRWMGIQITRKRLGEEVIGFEESGGYELLSPKVATEALGQTGIVNELVSDFLPDYITELENGKRDFGFVSEGSLVQIKEEGQVDTGRLLSRLESHVLELGVIIRTGAEVVQLDSDSLLIQDAHRGQIEFRAEKTIICTNAFASRLRSDLKIEPGRGQVFVTKPIEKLNFRGNLHIDEGFYYLRNVGDRLMFGGARNLDFETERTTEFGLNNSIQGHLEAKLRWLFGESFEFEVEQRWSGIMAFGKDKSPIIETNDQGLLFAVKLGGMGVALAGSIGEEVADRLL